MATYKSKRQVLGIDDFCCRIRTYLNRCFSHHIIHNYLQPKNKMGWPPCQCDNNNANEYCYCQIIPSILSKAIFSVQIQQILDKLSEHHDALKKKHRIYVSIMSSLPPNVQLSTTYSARIAGFVEKRGDVKEQKATSGSYFSQEDPCLF